jgi:hypothetical protein
MNATRSGTPRPGTPRSGATHYEFAGEKKKNRKGIDFPSWVLKGGIFLLVILLATLLIMLFQSQ